MRLFGSLNNYIEMYRKRTALSQAELAVLMAVENGSTVSRFESGERTPTLEGLIALEIICEQPIQKIFAGVADGVRENIGVRAAALLESTSDAKADQHLATKLSVLSRLAREDDVQFIPTCEDDN